ncbi:hypothetical protein B5C34_12925 [Pacificimonas flava]|uniref:ZIP Zinc transporter n=1 Tax=Pacificimonas flava TaxID=1234595 RepID=A0A219B8R5_9SPHN|nr:hypothetical protein B5C34_12925 [Pacificimonas flava]
MALAGWVIASLFACVHLFAGRLTILDKVPRSRWLSFAGGTSVAYVFVHLMPELAEYQEHLLDTYGDAELPAAELHIWLIALIGLSFFYCLNQLIRQHAQADAADRDAAPLQAFWLHLCAFAIYNSVIGYLLVTTEERGAEELALYGTAMALHLLVVDHGLRAQHGDLYKQRGRWLLAGAPLFGAALGSSFLVSETVVVALVALLAGSVVLNVLKEELPEDRHSRFGAFLFGAAAYSGLLIASG